MIHFSLLFISVYTRLFQFNYVVVEDNFISTMTPPLCWLQCTVAFVCSIVYFYLFCLVQLCCCYNWHYNRKRTLTTSNLLSRFPSHFCQVIANLLRTFYYSLNTLLKHCVFCMFIYSAYYFVYVLKLNTLLNCRNCGNKT